MLDLRRLVLEDWRIRIADMRGRGPYSGYPNKYRCVFIQIPKTASSGIGRILFDAPVSHKTYAPYLRANPNKFRSYFKFAIVRNPWDRLVSGFFFLKGGGMTAADAEWASKNLNDYGTFKEFVHGWVNEENIRSWVHFLPQVDFITDQSGRIAVDFLGRFERLEENFDIIKEALSISASLTVSNSSVHDIYNSYYDRETIDIVRRVYADDIRILKYDFDGPVSPLPLREDAE